MTKATRGERGSCDAFHLNDGEACDRAALDEIFALGQEARLDGKLRRDNPFAAGSEEREEWDAGWCATVEVDPEGSIESGYEKN